MQQGGKKKINPHVAGIETMEEIGMGPRRNSRYPAELEIYTAPVIPSPGVSGTGAWGVGRPDQL